MGLYGHSGAGIGDRDEVLDKMDIISGTLGKAFGVIGGYIAGTAALVDNIRSYGSGFIFTTSLPPVTVNSAITSIGILAGDEGRQLRSKHQSVVRTLRNKLVSAGLPVVYAPSHIIPVHVSTIFLYETPANLWLFLCTFFFLAHDCPLLKKLFLINIIVPGHVKKSLLNANTKATLICTGLCLGLK